MPNLLVASQLLFEFSASAISGTYFPVPKYLYRLGHTSYTVKGTFNLGIGKGNSGTAEEKRLQGNGAVFDVAPFALRLTLMQPGGQEAEWGHLRLYM